MTTLKTKHLTIEEIEALPPDTILWYFGTPEDTEFEHDLSRDRATYISKDTPEMYKDKIVYDMGCGFGTAAVHLANKYNCTVVGIEANETALQICRTKNAHPNITYKKALVSNTGLPPQSAHTIMCVETIEHLDEEERTTALKEWNRLLPIGGLLYITTPERRLPKHKYPEGSHWTEYDYEELIEIVSKEGFKFIVSKRKNQTDGTSMALLFEKIHDTNAKTDQNTPVNDINPVTNPVTRSCIDRYVLLSSFCKGKKVLSISSGYGYGEMILKALGADKVVGLDMDPKAIEYINNTYAPHVTGIVADFVKEDIDLKEKFDVIISVETFEHVSQQDSIKLLETIKRHMHDKTEVFITTPLRKTPTWTYNGGTHIYEYDSQEFSGVMNLAFSDTNRVRFFSLAEMHILKDYITVFLPDNKMPENVLSAIIMVAYISQKEIEEKK